MGILGKLIQAKDKKTPTYSPPIEVVVEVFPDGILTASIDPYKNNFNKMIHEEKWIFRSWKTIEKDFHILPIKSIPIEDSTQAITDWLAKETT